VAGVKIDSGEFPLMRNVDVSRQPDRMRVYTAWSKAFNQNVPEAVNHLADIVEDVYTFELWRHDYLDTPEEFFERIGIFGLDLDEPAKLIKELRKSRSSYKAQIIQRSIKAKELIAQGKTQREAAAELGVDRSTVSRDVCRDEVITPKMHSKREVVGYRITQYTKPETAAQKIRDIFGDHFADQLRGCL